MAIEVWTHLSVTPDNSAKHILMKMDPEDAKALAEIIMSADLNLFNHQWAETIDRIAHALKDTARKIT